MLLKELGNNRVHATIGSALDLFGGYLHFDEIVKLKPDIVLVAMGIPTQEKLIYKHLKKFDKGIDHIFENLYGRKFNIKFREKPKNLLDKLEDTLYNEFRI